MSNSTREPPTKPDTVDLVAQGVIVVGGASTSSTPAKSVATKPPIVAPPVPPAEPEIDEDDDDSDAEAERPEIDLDTWLQGGAGEPTSVPSRGQQMAMPDSDRVVVVGILADDSGSIANQGLATAMVEGLNLGMEAFKGSRGSDYFLHVVGFGNTIYYTGPLKNLPSNAFERYRAYYDYTPLVGTAIRLINDLRDVAGRYTQMGISTTVAMLIITDGIPEHDSNDPGDFKRHFTSNDYVVGMGVTGQMDKAVYHKLFASMGITAIFTPKSDPADVRHAIHEFSRSAAAR